MPVVRVGAVRRVYPNAAAIGAAMESGEPDETERDAMLRIARNHRRWETFYREEHDTEGAERAARFAAAYEARAEELVDAR